ncbi:MAG: transporter [Bdellovibrionales bacterium]
MVKYLLSGLLSVASLGALAQEEPIKMEAPEAETSQKPVKRTLSYYYSGENKQSSELTYRFINRNLEAELNEGVGGFYPSELNVKAHVFGYRKPLNKNFTLEVATSYLDTDVQINIPSMGPGMPASSISENVSGLSDSRIGLYHTGLIDKNYYKLDIGMYLPTGSVTEKYEISTARGSMSGELFPTAQLGSGTYDFNPVFTYKRLAGKITLANKTELLVRTGKNENDIRLGNELKNTFWMQYDVTPKLLTFLQVYYKDFGQINGYEAGGSTGAAARPGATTGSRSGSVGRPSGRPSAEGNGPRGRPTSSLNAMGPPAGVGAQRSFTQADIASGGSFVDITASVKYQIPTGGLGFLRPTVEVGAPIYQQYSTGDISMKSTWFLNAALEAYF